MIKPQHVAGNGIQACPCEEYPFDIRQHGLQNILSGGGGLILTKKASVHIGQ
jgi:hypothetical protein